MQLIDTHCHLYHKEFGGDITEVIQRAENEGVRRFYLPAVDSESHRTLLALEERYPGKCIGMMGLHPCSVGANYEEELKLVEDWLGKRPWVAVGEIGLDFYWDRTYEQQQYDAFRRQIGWALEYDIPIVIHSRDSMAECIGVVKEAQEAHAARMGQGAQRGGIVQMGETTGENAHTMETAPTMEMSQKGETIREGQTIQQTAQTAQTAGKGKLRGIFHCFNGNGVAGAAFGRQIIDLGFYLGIGGVITFKNAGLAEALADLPLERMVLETDAPYLSPVPFRGKRNESSYLRYVVAKLAEVKGVSVEEVARVTTENAGKIFGV